MRIVVDTNILISALGWKGNEYNLVRKVFQRELDISISPELLDEFRGVASRSKLGFSSEAIEEFVDVLIRLADVVVPKRKVSVIEGDPADNRVLECALASKADLLVSGDRHLLKLGEYKGIRIVSARQAMTLAGVG